MKHRRKTHLRNYQIFGGLLAVGMGSCVPAFAQASLPQMTLPQTPAAATPSYRIAPGDVLGVNVVDFPNLCVPQTVVTPDGTVSLSLVRQVSVAGLTVEQMTDLLTKRYKKYIVDPAISVSLVQKHQQIIVFSGSVNHPGVLEYRPNLHLIEALAEAGGLVTAGSPTTGSATTVGLQTTISDATHVVVTHEDTTKQTLDLTDPETKAGTETDILLEPGDVVYVPQQLGKISIAGEVKQPGAIPYRENLTIFDAVSDSGGFNPDTADLVNTKLTHDGKDSTVNLDPMLRHGDRSANVVLDPGDSLTIPELKNKTFVFGDVAHPGFYLYKPGDRIQNALSGVDGPTPEADLGKINVIHTDKITGATKMVKVDFKKFVLDGNPEGNPLIQPGDSLYIPDKHHTVSTQDILGTLSGIGSAAYGGRVLTGH